MGEAPGTVWIVGAGPGDPSLITLAGAAALARADLVVYDALASPKLLRHLKPGAEAIYAGKRAGEHALSQEAMNALLVDAARAGRTVVRLKGGDPFVFGRGGEEALACAEAGVPFRIVPGVTSALAGPAFAGIPVTHRGLAGNVLILTGHEAGEEATVDWAFAAAADTLVILMGATSLAENMAALIAAGNPPETPAACIRWATRPDQRTVTGTVATIADHAREAGIGAPMVTVIGAVAALGERLAWFDPGPLAGRSVVVTRARDQASGLAAGLRDLGAYVVEAPVIAIQPRTAALAADPRLTQPWDWVAFASANGVDACFKAWDALGRDARALAGTRIAAVGEATSAALLGRGVRADFVPSRATGACAAAELPVRAGDRVLLPQAAIATPDLAAGLIARGAVVETVTAYDTVAEPLDAERLREVVEADAVTFTSGSTARNLRAALGGRPLNPTTRLISIGPVTSEAVREAFGRVDAEASSATVAALIATVRKALT